MAAPDHNSGTRPTTGAAALSTDAPSLPLADVEALVARLYGIKGSVQSLASERDQNCRIETADGTRYVVKISNPSEPVSIVDFQILRSSTSRVFRPASQYPGSCGRWPDGRATLWPWTAASRPP